MKKTSLAGAWTSPHCSKVAEVKGIQSNGGATWLEETYQIMAPNKRQKTRVNESIENIHHWSLGMIVFKGEKKKRMTRLVAQLWLLCRWSAFWVQLFGHGLPSQVVSQPWFQVFRNHPKSQWSWNPYLGVYLYTFCLESSCNIVWSLWVICQNFTFHSSGLKTPKSVVLQYLTHWQFRRFYEGISSLNVNSERLKLSVKAPRCDSNNLIDVWTGWRNLSPPKRLT